MLRTNRWALFHTALCLLMSTAAWAGAEGKSDKSKADAGIAAYIGGKPITMAELDAKAIGTNMKLAQSLYDARKAALDQMIMERLLGEEAAAQGTTIDALIAKRLAEKATPVTDADVEAFYNANKARMRNQALEAMSLRIRQHLATQGQSAARQSLLDELKKKSDVRIALEPPRAEMVLAANDPVMGPANAKVTVVQYVDFQ